MSFTPKSLSSSSLASLIQNTEYFDDEPSDKPNPLLGLTMDENEDCYYNNVETNTDETTKQEALIQPQEQKYNKVIAFWDNSLCERGTAIAVFDYAYYNQKILNNKSIVLYNTTRQDNVPSVIEKFKKEFLVVGVPSFSNVDEILLKNKCDVFYIIKAGNNEGQLSKVAKNVVHCVFRCDEPHGDVYSAISPYIKHYNPNIPVVPHMVNLPDTKKHWRSRLGIPDNAVVYGRHGGYDTFDIEYVHRIV